MISFVWALLESRSSRGEEVCPYQLQCVGRCSALLHPSCVCWNDMLLREVFWFHIDKRAPIFVSNCFTYLTWCGNPPVFAQALAQQYSSELLQAELERTRINIACFMEPLDSVPETLKSTYSSFRGTVDSPSRNQRAQATGSLAFSRQRRRWSCNSSFTYPPLL